MIARDEINNREYRIVQASAKRKKIDISEGVPNGNLAEKPPLPPKLKKMGKESKLKVKFENIHTMTVQKLTSQADQLREEIQNLKAALANEQNAVRGLR